MEPKRGRSDGVDDDPALIKRGREGEVMEAIGPQKACAELEWRESIVHGGQRELRATGRDQVREC
jgi:hypothetical protein